MDGMGKDPGTWANQFHGANQVDLLIAEGASLKQMQRVCIVVTHATWFEENLRTRNNSCTPVSYW